MRLAVGNRKGGKVVLRMVIGIVIRIVIGKYRDGDTTLNRILNNDVSLIKNHHFI